jgi:dTDP-4-amino-4,6-dideoxygalactose transaminase
MLPLMNVQRQYHKYKEEIDEAVLGVLSLGQYINGENVHLFEREFAEYIGTRHAIAVANGTDALVISLAAAGVGPGDEVITTAMSFIATAEAIAAVGATPVFVDCTLDSFTLDVKQIECRISAKTKAIIPVQYYGLCADMDAINDIARRHHLIVIEDAAQAAGSEYKGKRAGSLGDIGCFSFFPTKNIGCCGDGGIIVTDNDRLADFCRALRVHGSGAEGKKLYEHRTGEVINGEMNRDSSPSKYFNYVYGYNSRLDEIQAAILRVKLKYLNEWNSRRISLAKRYHSRLRDSVVTPPAVFSDRKHCYYVYVVLTKDRDAMREYLNGKGITTGVYYPVPLHLQMACKYLGYEKGSMPIAEQIAEQSLAIPMFPDMTDSEQDIVIEAMNSFRIG